MNFKNVTFCGILIGISMWCVTSAINVAYRQGYRDGVYDICIIGKASREENN